MRLKIACLAAAVLPLAAPAQQPLDQWQSCTAIADGVQRLACFDDWAKAQRMPAPPPPAAVPPEAVTVPPPAPRRGIVLTESDGCRDTRYSDLARFWELEPGAECGTFGLRGYRPTSVDVAQGSSVNKQPTSENPDNNATTPIDYKKTETRLQISV